MFVRFSKKNEFKTIAVDAYGTSDPGGGGGIALDNRWDAAANFVHSFSPTLVMSANVGLARWLEGNNMQAYPFNPSTLGLPAFLDSLSNEFPDISVSGIGGLGPGSLSGGAGQGLFPRDVGSYSADLTKVLGPHTLKMGFMGVVFENTGGRMYVTNFNFPQTMTEGPDPTAANPATGYGFASFLLGAGGGGSTGINAFGAATSKMYGWYFQDDWKATRKLTLNLGLRYSLQPGTTERHNMQQWFNFTAANPISSKLGFTVPGKLVFAGGTERRALFDSQHTNFAPRIGLAYEATKKLVMRAGFGVFYVRNYYGVGGPSDGFSQATPYEATADGITPLNLLSDPFPNGVIQPTGRSLDGLQDVGLSTTAVQTYMPTPYVEQWTYGLQYAITPNNMIGITYLGNHGVKLSFSGVQENQLPVKDLALGNALLAPVSNPFYGLITSSACGLNNPTVPAGQLLRPFPEYCGVNNTQMPGAFSTYNAAEMTFRHRWSHAMEIGVSYTISKYIDNSSGPGVWANAGNSGIRNYYDLYAEKSLDGNDIPQSLVVNYVYQLPVGHGKKFGSNFTGVSDAILGGWQVSGIVTAKKGFPLSISDSSNNSNSFGGGQHPNLIGDPHLANPTINEWFNVNAFAQPAPFTFGNSPRYMPNLRAPGYRDWDVAIDKWWHWRERLRVEFRAEMFDAFNNVNFFAPNQTFGSPGFGTITAAERPRDIQFGLKVYW